MATPLTGLEGDWKVTGRHNLWRGLKVRGTGRSLLKFDADTIDAMPLICRSGEALQEKLDIPA